MGLQLVAQGQIVAWPLGSEHVTDISPSQFSHAGKVTGILAALFWRTDGILHANRLAQSRLCSYLVFILTFLSSFQTFQFSLWLSLTTKIILNHGKGDGHSSLNWPVNSFTFLPGPPKAKGLLCGSWPLTHRVFTSSQPFCVHTLETSSFIRIGPTWGFPLDFTIMYFFF